MAAPWRTPRMGGISCASWHSTTWSVPRKYKRLTPAYTGPYLQELAVTPRTFNCVEARAGACWSRAMCESLRFGFSKPQS